MLKFHQTVSVIVFSLLLTTSEVRAGIMVRTAGGFDTKVDWNGIGEKGGLLKRTINSQKPTNDPTSAPTGPTVAPTESPAPSPSPSAVPTNDPNRITESPTEAPTESPAPSPAPSAVPTNVPTGSPSAAPSDEPTVSAEPSSTPSATPSVAPSDFPSLQPSMEPSTSSAPSDAPTFSMAPSTSPTDVPSDMPSDSPSSAPSMSPTAITDRTKTAIATLLLEEIPAEMDRLTMAEFELFTLDFLRKKIPPHDDYVLNTLAVTVLSQTIIFPEPDLSSPPATTNDTVVRKLESENWNIALEIDIRTVGVVVDGRVPSSFNFTQEVLLSFYNNWDQYLWQLGNTEEFFNPLVEISDWEPQESKSIFGGKAKGKASFVIAVLFSFVAFSLAVFASYIAIRKHMLRNGKTPRKNTKSRGILFSPKNSPMNYPVLNYLTQTMSDDKNSPNSNYHDGDVEGGGAMTLIRNVNIDINEDGLESIALTPRANFMSPSAAVRNGLFVVNEGSDDDRSPLHSPMASSPMADQSSSSRIGGQIKKWLTPRGLKGGYASDALSNRRLSSDPPENQSTLGYNYGREYMEPDAKKASTKNNTGVYTTDKSTIDGRSKATGISYKKPSTDEGQFTLPISFFSKRGPGTNVSGADSPMSSLADSNASSFFAIGNMNKSFTGQVNASGAMEDEGFEVSTKKNPNSDSSILRTDQNLTNISQQQQEVPPVAAERTPSPSENNSVKSSVKRAAKRFEEEQQQMQQKPLREIQPPSSTVGVETILGARSRDSADEHEDKRSTVSSSFLKSRSMFSPNQKKEMGVSSQPKKSYGYGRVNVEVQDQETPRSVTSHSTLGARAMAKKDEDNDDKSTVSALSTLSSVMRRPGCYDVYAPSGPIGIVVDTSKNGPSVHSLKSTSPMLGLISPGDLIVALDGEDTRKMTAAALTRLMARKSRQKERKITLLS